MSVLPAAVLARLERPDGLQVVRWGSLAGRPFDPGMALLVLPEDGAAEDDGAADDDGADAVGGALPGRHGHGPDQLALLRRLYPAEHPVLAEDPRDDTTVGRVEGAALAASAHILPALEALANSASIYGLAWLVARLRGPGGCPWDREQDHRSLRPFLLEEAYEVYDALEAGAGPQLAEELGDLLLQIVLHAQLAAEAGAFDLADVERAIMTKIVRRHPHVFGDVVARTADDVLRNWERLKADERAAAAAAGSAPDGDGAAAPSRGDPDMPAAFAGLSRSLPALAYADEMQERAASLGYDWPDLEGVIDKIGEEAAELLEARDAAERHEEYGDLLFVMVNLGRKMGIDPEASLRAASRKFAGRFGRVERLAAGRGIELRALGLDALDELWVEAKAAEAP